MQGYLSQFVLLWVILFSLSSCGDKDTFETLGNPSDSLISFSLQNQEIIGGIVVTEEQFPATYKRIKKNPCTSTQIGPEVILLAAHCLEGQEGTSPQITIEISKDNSVKATCSRANEFMTLPYQLDLALCKIHDPLVRPFYEKINISDTVSDETGIMFAGFGCYIDEENSYDFSVLLRLAEGITKPQPYGVDEEGLLYAIPSNTDRSGKLCDGDSGGPAYVATKTFKEDRALIAVNKGDLKEHETFVALASNEASSFITKWKSEKKLPICGIDNIEKCGPPLGEAKRRVLE